MQLPAFVQAFLEGFTPGWLGGHARRPSAPDYFFAQDEEDDAEPGDALRGGESLRGHQSGNRRRTLAQMLRDIADGHPPVPYTIRGRNSIL
jgi:hypothetical protein